MAYCNITTDITDVYPEITRHQTLRKLEDWEQHSAGIYPLTFMKVKTGYIEAIFEWDPEAATPNPIMLTEKTSEATVNGSAGSWWWDSTKDVLYVHSLTDTTLEDTTNVFYSGPVWNTLLTRLRNEASEDFDSYMNNLHPTPLAPRNIKLYSSNDYESSIRSTVATMIVIKIMERLDPENEDIIALKKRVRNPNPAEGEMEGVIDELLNGKRVLQDQISVREVGSFNVMPYSGNGSDSHTWIRGKYTGPQHEIWRLEIDTAGVPGTATWKLSKDRGANWDIELQETFNTDNNDRRMYIGSGISVVFNPDGTFVDGDYWDIEVFPITDDPEKRMISTSKLTREDF